LNLVQYHFIAVTQISRSPPPPAMSICLWVRCHWLWFS